MPDTKISALPTGAPATASDRFPIERGASNFSLTMGNIMTYVQSNITGLTIVGGTTGQVLAKNSNSNYDFVWTTINIPALPLAVSSGGTGSTTAPNARTVLDVYSKAEVDALAGNVSDGAVTYAKLAAAAIGSTSETVNGTASKVVVAANFAPLLYGCSVYQTAAQSIPHNTWTTVNFDTEDYDDNTWHDNVTNNSRITVNFSGRVAVSAVGSTVGGTGSSCGVRIRKNGTVVASDQSIENTNSVAMDLTCAASDYFEIQVLQSSGGSSNTNTGVGGCRLAVRRIK